MLIVVVLMMCALALQTFLSPFIEVRRFALPLLHSVDAGSTTSFRDTSGALSILHYFSQHKRHAMSRLDL